MEDGCVFSADESISSGSRQELLAEARGMSEWYLDKVATHAPDLLPGAFELMSRLDRISAEYLNATIFVTNREPELPDAHVLVTIEYPDAKGQSAAKFVVPVFEYIDGAVPITYFFAHPGERNPDSGLPTEFDAISGLARNGALELGIHQGSTDYYGAYLP
jgi:hypothetical protein